MDVTVNSSGESALPAVGDFVLVEGYEVGVAKLASIDEGQARVTWFHSPARQVALEAEVPVSGLKRIELSNQRRVFHYDQDQGRWLIGRVDDSGRLPGHLFGSPDDLYFIAFPNEDQRRVPIPQLETRWDRPLDDPASLLAARTTATPFWHEGRAELMKSAMAQRAACGGLTGLFSASVELECHQVSVVRTVVNDPIPRYLLADEVGLGKTIEALAVLRQVVLENPDDHDTLIVVPPHLQRQWLEEASARFGLGPFLGKSICFASLDDLDAKSVPQMLIVDEAHHPASFASSSDDEERQQYAALTRLAHRTPRLLLLSATPVLRNEDGFLAILHLLDPLAYPLDDRKSFRKRVAKRQQVADWIGDLQDDAAPAFIEEALDGLADQLASDDRLVELVENARPLVDLEEDSLPRQHSLAAVRAHVGEIYRLHRRLLRNRRGSLEDVLWGRSGAKVLSCVDPIRAEADRVLLEWRGELMVAVYRDQAPRGDALDLWRHFLEAALSHPRALLELASARLERSSKDPDVPCPQKTLNSPWLFDEEEDLLRELVELLKDHQSPRDAALIAHLKTRPEDPFVVFVDRPAVASQLFGSLHDVLGGIVRQYDGHQDVADFLSGTVRVLICDASAEEGLNLQGRKATIAHYDLPLAPNRIEQRLGRLDRIGAKAPVSSLVFEDGAPLSASWLRLLRDPIRVFETSIASLQYLLDEHLKSFVENSFDQGLDAFQTLENALLDSQHGVQAELRRILHQERLDALETDPRERERFEAMEDFDAEPTRFQRELESWLVDRLQFRSSEADNVGWRKRYRYKWRGRRQTLIPVEDWLRWFERMVTGAGDTGSRYVATPELTFRRRQASIHQIPLVRLGHPLFDGAVAHAMQDDRGVAFAMWRRRPGFAGRNPLLAFRFDFLIEADPEMADWTRGKSLETSVPALQRRLDALLPPRFSTVWINDEMEEITDQEILSLLREPYSKRAARGAGDWNLEGERWKTVDRLYPTASWETLVAKVEARATNLVSTAPALAETVRLARRELATIAARVRAQLSARIDRLDESRVDVERAQLDREEAIFAAMDGALKRPRARLDSVGAVFLSR